MLGRLQQEGRHADGAVPVTGAVVFMIWPAPWLGRHLSWGLFVVSILLILASLGCLLRTALLNPGFLPRIAVDEDEEYGCVAHAAVRIKAPHTRAVGRCKCRNALCSPTIVKMMGMGACGEIGTHQQNLCRGLKSSTYLRPAAAGLALTSTVVAGRQDPAAMPLISEHRRDSCCCERWWRRPGASPVWRGGGVTAGADTPPRTSRSTASK